MNRCPPPPCRLKVVDLNPHLSCILCGGYFIDATTITECLHSFCRACIVRYLETSEYCPVCEVQVHKSRPLRSDKILQDIVYKLVPGLFHNEMKRRRELYASQPPEAIKESRDAEDRGECLDEKFIYAPDEIFSLSIEYGKEVEKDPASEDDNVARRRFLRCPAAVTVSHLKKFVRMKYGIPNSYEIDLKYDKESVLDEYTLIDVAYIFLWRRRGPMRFFYKIVERPPRKSSRPVRKEEDHPTLDTAAMDDRRSSTETDTKDKTEDVRPTPVQSVPPQSSDKDAAPTSVPDGNLGTNATADLPKQPQKVSSPEVVSCPPTTPVERIDAKEGQQQQQQQASTATRVDESSTTCKETPKSILPFRFPPVSQSSNKSSSPLEIGSSSNNKPAVMTVAPLTTGTTSVTHHGTTSISIKKSLPSSTYNNTPLPPFKISAHLLAPTPKVPPLKLSPPRFSKLETCLRELSSSSKKSSSSSSKKSRSSRSCGSEINKLELKVAQLKSSAAKCVAPLVIKMDSPSEAKMEIVSGSRKDFASSSVSTVVTTTPSGVPPVPLPSPTKLLSEDNKKKNTVTTTKSAVCETPRDKVVVEQQQPTAPVPPTPVIEVPPPVPVPIPEPKSRLEDNKRMDLDDEEDSELFEGPLVIAEPPDIPKDDSDNSRSPPDDTTTTVPPQQQTTQESPKCVPSFPPPAPQQTKEVPQCDSSSSPIDDVPPKPPVDSEDEEIDVEEIDSGRGSDVSSGRTEARSLCGFDLDDLGSPDSVPPPKTPETPEHRTVVPPTASSTFLPDPKSTHYGESAPPPKTNGVVAADPKSSSGGGDKQQQQQPSLSNGDSSGVLDLSTCSRKRGHEDDDEDRQRHRHHRAKQVANPAVLDKSRQTTTPCISPRNHQAPPPFKVLAAAQELPHHVGLYNSGGKGGSGKGNFKCRGNTLTVINPDPNGSRPKIVIRNLGPRPLPSAHERFHHHHHHHHHHSNSGGSNHQRM